MSEKKKKNKLNMITYMEQLIKIKIQKKIIWYLEQMSIQTKKIKTQSLTLFSLKNITKEYIKIQDITLSEHQYNAVVKVRDANTKQDLTTVKKGQKVELYIFATIDGNTTEEYNVKWEYYGNKENDNVSSADKKMNCTPASVGDLNYQAEVTIGNTTLYLKTQIPVIE